MSRIRDIANLFSGSTDAATDAEVVAAIGSHTSASDPHGDRAAATSAISTHASVSNGHYLRGDTASRPTSPSTGDLYFDTTINKLLVYYSSGWKIQPNGNLPAAPTSVTATPGTYEATVTWVAPSISDGFAIIDYAIEYSSNSGSTWSSYSHSMSTSTSATITGLTGGGSYIFRIAALSALGYGSYSTSSSSITVSSLVISGGTEYTSGGYKYHKFTSNGTLTISGTKTVEVLAIGGGGSGGGTVAAGGNNGGGGAGGVLYHSSKALSTGNYSVVIGAGGSSAANNANGNPGSNSTFDTMTAYGGGFGSYSSNAAGSGGSGGGSGYTGGAAGSATQTINGGATTAYGNNGASGGTEGGGGGGAGGAGAQGTSVLLGQGGVGINTYSTWATATTSGINGYYAGGGGGAPMSTATDQGRVAYSQSGVTNTGGGGGGRGGLGASGIVIVRYTL